MNILLTGAAGFIGSHIAEALLARGDSVVGLDNFDPFYPRFMKERNLSAAAAAAPGRFALIEGDIRDAAALDAAFERRVDAVVHLAALAGVRPSIADPLRYMDVNVTGTARILEAMRRHAVQKLVFASSSSVYGNAGKVPFSEDDPVDRPISPYAASKRAGELVIHSYHHLFGIAADCLRFFTVYGPRQRPDLAIRKFAGRMLDGEPIPVFGDGGMSRDFTFIGDIARGTLSSLDSLSGYRILNIGNSNPVSVNQLIALMEKAIGKKAVIERLPRQDGDVERTFADIDRAREALGYKPETSMEDGLGIFAQWLRNERSMGKEG